MPKKSPKIVKKAQDTYSANQVGVIIESFIDKMDFLIEGQRVFEERVEKRFSGLESRFDNLESRFDNLENRFDSFQTETRNNFTAVFDYLSRIEDELVEVKAEIRRIDQNKVDKREFILLVAKVKKIEKELAKYRAIAMSKVK